MRERTADGADVLDLPAVGETDADADLAVLKKAHLPVRLACVGSRREDEPGSNKENNDDGEAPAPTLRTCHVRLLGQSGGYDALVTNLSSAC